MIHCDTGYAPRPKARIEIIPLIDVIFFLLATFVLFTLSLQKMRSIEVILPQGGIDPGEGDTTVFIQTSAEGTFYWKKGRDGPAELISGAEIGPRLASYKRTVAVPRVLIRTDRTANSARPSSCSTRCAERGSRRCRLRRRRWRRAGERGIARNAASSSRLTAPGRGICSCPLRRVEILSATSVDRPTLPPIQT